MGGRRSVFRFSVPFPAAAGAEAGCSQVQSALQAPHVRGRVPATEAVTCSLPGRALAELQQGLKPSSHIQHVDNLSTS